jgi:hypothetical protein
VVPVVDVSRRAILLTSECVAVLRGEMAVIRLPHTVAFTGDLPLAALCGGSTSWGDLTVLHAMSYAVLLAILARLDGVALIICGVLRKRNWSAGSGERGETNELSKNRGHVEPSLSPWTRNPSRKLWNAYRIVSAALF